MGILSSAVSITRYQVEGKLQDPVMETVADGLRRNVISEIDEDAADRASGWTSLERPFQPNFEGSSFVVANLFLFALRLDRKTIPPKLLKKHLTLETEKYMAKTHRRFLAKDEKQTLKDKVLTGLAVRMPSTPNVYDVIWNYEERVLWFFSNLRSANEELETLFKRSFNLSLIRFFPYTAADLVSGLTDQERDVLSGLSPTQF